MQNLTEKQIMLFKTTINGLFNYIWCYLFIGCFDGKIGVFQQTAVKGLLYPYPFNDQWLFHIETSQLICRENQYTGFYMREELIIKGLKSDYHV